MVESGRFFTTKAFKRIAYPFRRKKPAFVTPVKPKPFSSEKAIRRDERYEKRGEALRAAQLYFVPLNPIKYTKAILFRLRGGVAIQRGDYLRAEEHLKKALEYSEKMWSRDGDLMHGILEDLSHVSEKLGKNEAAGHYRKRAEKYLHKPVQAKP